MPDDSMGSSANGILMNDLLLQVARSSVNRSVYCSGNPLPFLKCANGTLLPLTVRSPSVSMNTQLGKKFTTTPREAGLANGRTDCFAAHVRRAEQCGSTARGCQPFARHNRRAAYGGRTKRESAAGEHASETVPGISWICGNSRIKSV